MSNFNIDDVIPFRNGVTELDQNNLNELVNLVRAARDTAQNALLIAQQANNSAAQRVRFRGNWVSNPNPPYAANDMVRHSGEFFIANTNNAGTLPPGKTNFEWLPIVNSGFTHDLTITGSQGAMNLHATVYMNITSERNAPITTLAELFEAVGGRTTLSVTGHGTTSVFPNLVATTATIGSATSFTVILYDPDTGQTINNIPLMGLTITGTVTPA